MATLLACKHPMVRDGMASRTYVVARHQPRERQAQDGHEHAAPCALVAQNLHAAMSVSGLSFCMLESCLVPETWNNTQVQVCHSTM